MSREIFAWELVPESHKSSGTKKSKCPKCSESRKNKNEPCLYINYTSGVALCYNCDSLSMRDSQEKIEYNKVNYKLPPQDWNKSVEFPESFLEYFTKERKISEKTLKDFKITREKYYQPAKQKETINIVFNYFEGDQLVNKKYRTRDKCFTQTQGGKPIFYNINSAIGSKECWVTEGEIDVLSLYEVGIKSAISLPNGANDNDAFWINSEKYLQDVESFIIATDCDEKGIAIREKIAHRLGKFRCKYVEFEHKDANGDLQNGVLASTILNKKIFPVSGTIQSGETENDLFNLYDKGIPEMIYPKCESFGHLKNIFKMMLGQLVVATGIPSHGKSTFTDWLVLNLCNDYDFKASIFSPEHQPIEIYVANLCQKVIGRPFFQSEGSDRMSKQDVKRSLAWMDQKLYFTMQEKGISPTWSWLLGKFKEQLFIYGINIFVIDAFNKVLFDHSKSKDSIDQILTELTSFCTTYNVLIFLVAHPTKMKKNEQGRYEEPDLYDVSGTADFRNQTHAGFCIYRYFGSENYTTFRNLKTKFSFQGQMGETVSYEYDLYSGRYYLQGHSPSKTDLTYGNKDVEEKITKGTLSLFETNKALNSFKKHFEESVEESIKSEIIDEYSDFDNAPDDLPF